MYVVSHPRFPGVVKIGTTSDMAQRMRCFQTHCPDKSFHVEAALVVDDRRALEKALHAHFGERRSARTEWFRVSPAEAVEALAHHSTLATLPQETP